MYLSVYIYIYIYTYIYIHTYINETMMVDCTVRSKVRIDRLHMFLLFSGEKNVIPTYSPILYCESYIYVCIYLFDM